MYILQPPDLKKSDNTETPILKETLAEKIAHWASIAKHIEIDQKMSSLTCDYLVIGAGASAMAFVDELVNSSKKLTVVLVDKRAKPGETIKWESF